ncbi:MAG: alpha/beta hydrolase [Pseudomonadota bacterium]
MSEPARQSEPAFTEGIAKVGELDIAYRCYGDANDPPVLLVMGFNMSLLVWPEPFVQALLDRGRYVIVFDNRDVGLSSRIHSALDPHLPMLTMARMSGLQLPVPYTLEDMARDAVGVLDWLKVPAAHVIGVSMGGMIAQVLAIHHAERLTGLGLVMTHPGAVTYSIPSPKLASLLLDQPGESYDSQLQFNIKFWNLVCGPDCHPPESEIRRLTDANCRRSREPHGRYRQMAAIITALDRSPWLREVRIPTTVVHGTDDPLIIPRGGKTLARLIPGARLKLIAGMGHILPPERCEEMVAFMLDAPHEASPESTV